eukprot:scaffold428365_cov22-Prasinocladus_malaysianus.AAC.1
MLKPMNATAKLSNLEIRPDTSDTAASYYEYRQALKTCLHSSHGLPLPALLVSQRQHNGF